MKKRNFVKCVAMLTAVCMLFAFAGCGKKGTDKGGDGPTGPVTPIPSEELYQGIHNQSAVARSDAFMENGATAYKIVIPAEDNGKALTSANEIVYFIREASGVTIPIIEDTGLTHTADGRYISIGATALSQGLDVVLDYEEMGDSGYKLLTKDKSVYLLGAGQYGYGLIYAAYDFLKYCIGYEFYTMDTIVYDKNVTDIPLYDFNIYEVPDFDWRVATYMPAGTDTVAANRYRAHRRNDGSFMVQAPSGSISHTLESMFDSKTDPAAWFGDDGYQMCFSAHGYGADFEAFTDAAAERAVKLIAANPQASIFNLGQTDKNVWCDCETCSAEKNKYGTDSAVLIKWANKVAEKTETILDRDYNGRQFMLSIFAYQKTIDAPVKEENGQYVPIDDSVKLRDNLAILLAIHNGKYTKSLSDPTNANAYANGLKWGALTKNVYTWIYSTNFDDYLAPFNSFNAMQGNYNAAKQFNSVWIHDQAQYDQPSPTGFSVLKLYLNSELQWQINQNMGELTDKFFANYFGPAAPAMRKYYEELRTHMDYLESSGNSAYSNAIYFVGITDSSLWPAPVLEKWLGYIEEAYAAIEQLKMTDGNLYETLEKHIRQESISIRYLDIAIYKRVGNLELKNKFRDDCTELNITERDENNRISVLYKDWGIL